jgi:hypothetical protein
MASELSPCRCCRRSVVYGTQSLCARCENRRTEHRFKVAKAHYRATHSLTEADIYAGMGSTLSSVEDQAPIYAELNSYVAEPHTDPKVDLK